jgi:hypothetical protein
VRDNRGPNQRRQGHAVADQRDDGDAFARSNGVNAYRTVVRGWSVADEIRCSGARPCLPAASMMLTARRQ